MNVPLDVLLRAGGAAVGLVFLLVVAVSVGWRQRGDLMLLIFCAVAYLLCSAPARPCCTTPWTLPLLMGAAGFPFAFWRLAKVVLEDETAIVPQAWAGLAVLLVSAMLAAPDYLREVCGGRREQGGRTRLSRRRSLGCVAQLGGRPVRAQAAPAQMADGLHRRIWAGGHGR
jgi:hypothetical protein